MFPFIRPSLSPLAGRSPSMISTTGSKLTLPSLGEMPPHGRWDFTFQSIILRNIFSRTQSGTTSPSTSVLAEWRMWKELCGRWMRPNTIDGDLNRAIKETSELIWNHVICLGEEGHLNWFIKSKYPSRLGFKTPQIEKFKLLYTPLLPTSQIGIN